ncbi:MAG: DUF5677 domain-containing protein [bacterium]|nr:DUF5677 domain-containing protein [bacterium]
MVRPMTDTPDYEHEAIIDAARLGNHPSKEYLDRVDMLDNVVRECMYVSRIHGGIPSPTTRHYYASVLFTALITRGVSLAQLVPFTPWADKKIEHWDYSTAAGIVRTMLELRVAFYYLCEDKCSDDEWNCRWNIFNMHDCSSRIKLFTELGNTEEADKYREHANEIRDRLISNAHFNSLAVSEQKKCLNGKKPYVQSYEDIAEKAGIEKTYFRWLYTLFSSHVHGLPMSFYRIGCGLDGRGCGLPTPAEENYTSLCLSLASTFLVGTRDEITALFADVKKSDSGMVGGKLDGENIVEEVNIPSDIQIGQSVILAETDEIRIRVERTSQTRADLFYEIKATGDIVLHRTDSEDEGVVLNEFDSVYWRVLINGSPATMKQLDKAFNGSMAFKVDHIARTLHIKT